jgi:hypothetical protein
MPEPGILHTVHNISPCLDKQLVLELKVRVEVLELLEPLPGGFLNRHSMPLDENVPDITSKLGAQDVLWSRQ